jgi:hypothetical protein
VYNDATRLSIPSHRNPAQKEDSMKLLAKFNLILLVVFGAGGLDLGTDTATLGPHSPPGRD